MNATTTTTAATATATTATTATPKASPAQAAHTAAGRAIDRYLAATLTAQRLPASASAVVANAADSAMGFTKSRAIAAIRKAVNAANAAQGGNATSTATAQVTVGRSKRTPLAAVVHNGKLYQVTNGEHLDGIPESWKRKEFETIVVFPMGRVAA